MEVLIDCTNCRGCKLCADTCSEIFEVKDRVSSVRLMAIPKRLHLDCRYACSICPNSAISVTETFEIGK